MNVLVFKGKKKRVVNVDNVLYVEERERYTNSETPKKAVTIYFLNGSSIDVNVDFDKVEEALSDMSGNYYESFNMNEEE